MSIDLDVASTRIISWRSASSSAAEWLVGIDASAAPAGLVAPADHSISTTAPTAITSTEAIVAIMRVRTCRRLRRRASARLRCCDSAVNAVLPSARHVGKNTQRADHCGSGQRVA